MFKQSQTEVDAYLPDDVWYELRADNLSPASETGHVKLSDRPSGVPPIHFRGDSIIPVTFIENLFRYNTSNTEAVRRGYFFLLVIPGKTKTATGDLFWDDGESIITIESGKYK